MTAYTKGKSSPIPSLTRCIAASRFPIPVRLLTVPLALLMAQSLGGRPATAQGSTPGTEPPFTILHTFSGGAPDGFQPRPSLMQASDGNFYGLESYGSFGSGSAFMMTPAGALTLVHTFADERNPLGTLIQGPDSDFYGTTTQGGFGSGSVYKMTPTGAVTVLHVFRSGPNPINDGIQPETGVILASDGNFYGTTQGNGFDLGTVFKMAPDGTFTTLHTFGDGSVPNDGLNPAGNLVQGPSGTLYETVSVGGDGVDGDAHGNGIVYKISPTGSYIVLHRFGDGSVMNDGVGPYGGIILGSDGSFYGTTLAGGAAGRGTVFKMTQAGVITILHSFTGIPYNGDYEVYSVIEGWDGNLYGTTSGDYTTDQGTIFRISTGLPPIRPVVIAPAGLTAAAGDNQVTLSWTAGLGATSYNIYRGTSPDGEAATPVATGVTTTTFVNTRVPNEITYYYKVKGVNGTSISPYSFEASATPEPPVPGAPWGLTAASGNAQITLHWTAGSRADTYSIYRVTIAGGEIMTPIATGLTAPMPFKSGTCIIRRVDRRVV